MKKTEGDGSEDNVWATAINPIDQTRHVVPHEDLVPHTLSMECECNPSLDQEDSNIIIHYSWRGLDLIDEIESGEA